MAHVGLSNYKGEIGFFDFYIIPLSEKLRDCGVFGPTSDENLNYATNNRNMWLKEGEEITKDMLKRAEAYYKMECSRGGGATRGLRVSTHHSRALPSESAHSRGTDASSMALPAPDASMALPEEDDIDA